MSPILSTTFYFSAIDWKAETSAYHKV